MNNLDKRAGIVISIAGVIFRSLAIKKPTDTVRKLAMMRHDMNAILKNGGAVAMESSNSKYGSAYLYTGIDPCDMDIQSSGQAMPASEHRLVR